MEVWTGRRGRGGGSRVGGDCNLARGREGWGANGGWGWGSVGVGWMGGGEEWMATGGYVGGNHGEKGYAVGATCCNARAGWCCATSPCCARLAQSNKQLNKQLKLPPSSRLLQVSLLPSVVPPVWLKIVAGRQVVDVLHVVG